MKFGFEALSIGQPHGDGGYTMEAIFNLEKSKA